MGLDMYAYVAAKAGAQADYDEGMAWDKEKGAIVNPSVTEPREIAYWRKHPNLHGWMQRLWVRKNNERLGPRDKSGWWTDPDRAGEFNGVELELTWADIDRLEDDIKNADDFFGKTAYYNPSNKTITLYTLKRHPKDVLRSFVHEMIHHKQNLEGKLNNIQGQNINEDDYLKELEREAYEYGNGLLFRGWENLIKGND